MSFFTVVLAYPQHDYPRRTRRSAIHCQTHAVSCSVWSHAPPPFTFRLHFCFCLEHLTRPSNPNHISTSSNYPTCQTYDFTTTQLTISIASPERGSFPLDHDAECQPIMKAYLRCLRAHRGVNDDECRMLSKSYLVCRMERYVFTIFIFTSAACYATLLLILTLHFSSFTFNYNSVFLLLHHLCCTFTCVLFTLLIRHPSATSWRQTK